MNNPITSEPVLTVGECDILTQVKTTDDEARAILERNLPLLEALENEDAYSGTVGCPHCIAVSSDYIYGCDQCAWREPIAQSGLVMQNLACCSMTFGGVHLVDAAMVGYSVRSENVYDKLRTGEQPDARSESITFVRGHIEWACMVLGIVSWRTA